MNIRPYCIALLTLMHLTLTAQKYVSGESLVVFYSHAPIEDIRAENSKGTALFDSGSGNIAIVIPIKEFRFAKALMQEHFNEKYLESERFPKSTFQGTILGFDSMSDSLQRVTAKGKLTIHGVTRSVELPVEMRKTADVLKMHSVFKIRVEDFKIKIPTILWQNIAEEIEVTTDFSFRPK